MVEMIGRRMASSGVVACAAGVAFLVVLGVALLEMARFGGAEGVEDFLEMAGNAAIFSAIPLVLVGAWLLDRLEDRNTSSRDGSEQR